LLKRKTFFTFIRKKENTKKLSMVGYLVARSGNISLRGAKSAAGAAACVAALD